MSHVTRCGSKTSHTLQQKNNERVGDKKTDNTQIDLKKTSSGNPRPTSNQSSNPCTVLQYPSRKTLQQIAAQCNTPLYTLQHNATQCNTRQHTATHCNTLQHTATHCNTLQHTATHCNTLQHIATWRGF